MDHFTEMRRVDHRIFSAVFFVNRRMLGSNGIYGMKKAGNVNVPPLHAAVHITIAMIVVDGKTKQNTHPAAELCGKRFIF